MFFDFFQEIDPVLVGGRCYTVAVKPFGIAYPYRSTGIFDHVFNRVTCLAEALGSLVGSCYYSCPFYFK